MATDFSPFGSIGRWDHMHIAASAKRLAAGTTLVLVALWAFAPKGMTPNRSAETALPSQTTDPNPQVLGTNIEGVVFRITSDTATQAGLMLDMGQGPTLQAIDLPYVGRVSPDTTVVVVNATTAKKAVLRCTVEQNDKILVEKSRAENVECSALLTPDSTG